LGRNAPKTQYVCWGTFFDPLDVTFSGACVGGSSVRGVFGFVGCI